MAYETPNSPTIVNGINTDDLKALAAAVAADPAAGQTNWKVRSEWRGRTHNRSYIDGFGMGGEYVERKFTIDVDEPEELGGSNRFPNPQEYLIAALNSCMMVGYAALCALNGIRLDHLEIETEGDIDLRGFLGLRDDITPGYESLKYTVRIKGDATAEQFEEIHRAVQKTSPNFNNIARAVQLNATLVVD